MSQTRQPRRRWLIIAGIGAALIVGAVLITPRAAPAPAPIHTSSAEDSRALGPADAPVAIVEYADFGCPSCKAWHEAGILDQVRQKYGDKLRFVWRDFDTITLNSHKAALAARCAADQGRFWEFHDALFAHAPQFDLESLKQYAAELNLDTARFNPCLEDRQHRDEVLADRQDAFDRGFRGTPTFLVNDRRVDGPPSFETLVELIDAGLAMDDNPTTGAIVRSTRQVQATQAAATVTHIAKNQAEATATVAARATAQAIVSAKAAWPLLIDESFTDNRLGWPLGLKQDHSLAVTSTIEAGLYQWVVKVANGNSYFNLIPANSPSLDRFRAAVSVQFIQGNDDGQSAYGLTFRHVEDDYGFFGILKSGEFLALEVHHTGIYQSIGGSSPAIDTRPGQRNRLEVVGIGSDYVFLINGQRVAQMTADIAPGRVGLGVDSARRADTARVEFSDFDVYAP